MPDLFQNFDLLITKQDSGYTARVLESPSGQITRDFVLPFSPLELGEFMLKLRPPRRGQTEVAAAKEFGKRLFEAVFSDDLLGLYRASLDATARAGEGLRFRLRLSEVPDLADIPWEYLYDSSLDRFLSLSSGTPVVRFLDLPERIPSLRVDLPLRVLVVISSPSEFPPLDVEREWSILKKAAGLAGGTKIILDRVEAPTLTAVQQRLRQSSYHILHYIGHGDFDEKTQTGMLIFENETGQAFPVSGDTLGVLLHDHSSLRMVVLNACEGARSARGDVYSGVGQNIMQQGIPAVLAMQFPISDSAALKLAQEFYSALGDGYTVDSALGEARKAISLLENSIEWGTPVLFMRSQDGHLFSFFEESQDMADGTQAKKGGGIQISVGGNVSGKIEAAEGDIIHGDVVQGDKISVGNITGGTGVAIGRGAQANVSQVTGNPFSALYSQVQQLPIPDFKKEEVTDLIKKLEDQKDADKPEQDRVDYYLGKLEELTPAIVETLVTALTNPGAAIGKGLQTAIHVWREARRK